MSLGGQGVSCKAPVSEALSLSSAPGRLVLDTVSSRQGLRYPHNYHTTAQWSVGQTQTHNFLLSKPSPALALQV